MFKGCYCTAIRPGTNQVTIIVLFLFVITLNHLYPNETINQHELQIKISLLIHLQFPPSPSSSVHHTAHHTPPCSSTDWVYTSAFKLDVIVLFYMCHSAPSLLPSSLALRPPSPFLPSLSPSALSPFPLRTSMGHHCHAVLWCNQPFGRTRTPLLVVSHAHKTSYVYSCHFFFSLPPCWAYSSSSSLSLVSQILRDWSLLSGGTRGQLNIYGSTSIQMFGYGESLWPENWHDLFVHNMQQGRCWACPQHVSACVFVVCVCVL